MQLLVSVISCDRLSDDGRIRRTRTAFSTSGWSFLLHLSSAGVRGRGRVVWLDGRGNHMASMKRRNNTVLLGIRRGLFFTDNSLPTIETHVRGRRIVLPLKPQACRSGTARLISAFGGRRSGVKSDTPRTTGSVETGRVRCDA